MDAILAVSQDSIWMNWQVHPVIAAEKEHPITAASRAETDRQKECQTAAGTADAARQALEAALVIARMYAGHSSLSTILNALMTVLPASKSFSEPAKSYPK